MKTIVLLPVHQDTILQKMIDIVSANEYYNNEITPHFGDMAAWEVKEYRDIHYEQIDEYTNLKKYISDEESVFNEILSQYNLSVATFIWVLGAN